MSRIKRFDHEISRFDETPEQRGAFRAADVKGDSALASVEGKPAQTLLRIGQPVVRRTDAAPGIATGRLDLDDVRAEIAEHFAAEPALLVGQIERAKRAQRGRGAILR